MDTQALPPWAMWASTAVAVGVGAVVLSVRFFRRRTPNEDSAVKYTNADHAEDVDDDERHSNTILTVPSITMPESASSTRNATFVHQRYFLKEREKFEALVKMTTAISKQVHIKDVITNAVPIFIQLCSADRCSVWLSDASSNMLRTFVMTVQGTEEIVIPMGTGVVGKVAETGENLNIKNAYEDPRFDTSVDRKTGYQTKSILCVPILHPDQGVIGAVQMLNKTRSPGYFSADDENVCFAFGSAVAVALYNATLRDSLARAQRRSEALIHIMKITTSAGSITDILQRIVEAGYPMLYALEMTMFLVDGEKREFFAKVTSKKTSLMHVPMDAGTPEGKCCLESEVINIPNIYDSSFAHTVPSVEDGASASKDSMPVLCVPACFRSGKPIAVIKVSGKERGQHTNFELAGGIKSFYDTFFDHEDVELLKSMAAEVAVILKRRSYEAQFESAMIGDNDHSKEHDEDEKSPSAMHRRLIQRSGSIVAAVDQGAQQPSLLRLYTRDNLSLRRSGSPNMLNTVPPTPDNERRRRMLHKEEIVNTLRKNVSSSKRWLRSVDFDAFECSPDELKAVVGAVFEATGLMADFNIQWSTLSNFIDSASKGYLDNPYHNFRHGCTVMHVCYMVGFNGGGSEVFSRLELLALMIASLCHDIGHTGTNNNYLINSKDELAVLYNDRSVLENMHSWKTFLILQKEDHNILSELTRDQWTACRKTIISAILATDMANHLAETTKLKAIASQAGEIFDKGKPEHKEMLLNAVIHAADVSNPNFRPDVSRKWSDAVAIEFNAQIEEEKRQGLPVSDYLGTTDEPSLAKLNLGFIDFVVAPLWNALAELMDTKGPVFTQYLKHLKLNRDKWASIRAQYEKERATTPTKASTSSP